MPIDIELTQEEIDLLTAAVLHSIQDGLTDQAKGRAIVDRLAELLPAPAHQI